MITIYEDNVLALQFHLEMDKASIENIIKECKSELTTQPFVQTADEILSNENYINVCRNELFDMHDGFESSIG